MANHGMHIRSIAFKFSLVLLTLLVFPLCGQCQLAQVDLSVDYSFLRAYPNGNGFPFNSNGGSISAAWNVKPKLGIVGDFGGYKFGGQLPGVDGQLFTYSFGPRYSFRSETRRWTPFAQVLAGGAHVSGTASGQSASENGLSVIVGGGVDAAFRPRLTFRIVEFDYLLTRFNRVPATNGIQNDFRISTGIVFHFGHR